MTSENGRKIGSGRHESQRGGMPGVRYTKHDMRDLILDTFRLLPRDKMEVFKEGLGKYWLVIVTKDGFLKRRKVYEGNLVAMMSLVPLRNQMLESSKKLLKEYGYYVD